jgi:dipeptidase
MMAILSDHSDGQSPQEDWQTAVRSSTGICRHPEANGEGGCTAASLVAELCADGSRLPIYWCSLYSPCLTLFLPIFMEGELPPVLTLGDGTPSTDSPWWLFHGVNRLVMNGSPDAAERVRNGWQPMQQALFASAYAIAREAKQLLDDGYAAEATSRLTDYMATNAARMIDTLQTLHNELAEQRVLA